ncbi:MAG: DUF853 domain-containing protein [Clostridia bacterium]|nr:DUF853 domain-containing protein [Clostridia bacterium]
MLLDNKIIIGKSNDKELYILPDKANRHGLITGASGSGKTITLKVMAESFSAAGVPVFLSDVKGDLAGMCKPGVNNEKIAERLQKLGIADTFTFESFPTVFWDVYGEGGHPIRTTVSSVGSTILSRMLGLTDAQAGVLAIAFKIARDTNMELIDLKDLRLLLQHIGENRTQFTTNYGNVSVQSIGGIQRSILMLQEQGGDYLFGEPAIDIKDFIKFDTTNGYGNINVLHAVELFKQPILYSCFMLWILTYLNQNLPEIGDLEKPKMVFFFDEAHLLFDDMPKYMLTQVTQVVKLIRSKGIGLYFISQTPNDIPNDIQSQLGNRVQHTLRAYTPAEQKVVKAVASSFRANPEFDTERAILELGTGEALVTFLNEKGEPGIVEKVTVLPPQSQMGTIDNAVRSQVIDNSRFKGKYDELIDKESAFEIIQAENKRLEEEKSNIENTMYSDYKEPDNQPKGMFSSRNNSYPSRQKPSQNNNKTSTQPTRKTTTSRTRTTSKKRTKSTAEKAFTKASNSALTSFGRKVGNEIFKKLFK